jgi:hypothetical protein
MNRVVGLQKIVRAATSGFECTKAPPLHPLLPAMARLSCNSWSALRGSELKQRQHKPPR